MKRKLSRRDFATHGLHCAAGVAIGTAAPGGWVTSLASTIAREGTREDKILVVVELTGGNDGLNTIIPFSNENYLKARPKLAIPKSDVLRLDAEMGLHPSMRGIAKLIESEKFCIVHGVGYPNPNRSHFESMDIWHSCQRKENRLSDGWLGRMFAMMANEKRADSLGLHLGNEAMPLALVGRGVQTPSLATVDQLRWKGKVDSMQTASNSSSAENSLLDFVSASTSSAMQASERLDKALAESDSSGDFPETQLGEKLKVISRLIVAGLKTKVYYVTLDGFDTHANQLPAHAGLIRQWSDALQSFHTRLDRAGIGEQVLVLTFSEFGRRVGENASQGTDHGAAAPTFLSGPKLGPSTLGVQPSLAELEDGDLKFTVDFRSVYATLIEDWLGVSSKTVLTDTFDKLTGLKLG